MKSSVVVGMSDVLARLNEVARTCGDISPTFPVYGQMWERRQQTVFDTANQGRWVGFAPNTIRQHESPLIDEGIMEAGMTSARPRYDDKHMVAFGPPKGNRRVQAVATLNAVGHKSRGETRVDPRPVVPPLSATERRMWLGVIEDHIREALND